MKKSNPSLLNIILLIIILCIKLSTLLTITTFFEGTGDVYELQLKFYAKNEKLKIINCGIIESINPVGTPILIDNNTDFAIQANNNGWRGVGTKEEPLIIENLTIVTISDYTNAIEIKNTNLYFVIHNCTVAATNGTGFLFKNVSNLLLTNNTAQYCIDGFCFEGDYIQSTKCSLNVIENNIAKNNSKSGFKLITSESNNLINNIALGNEMEGFYLEDSDNNNLTRNNAQNNLESGFKIYDSYYNKLINNSCQNNGVDGFELRFPTEDTILINNTSQMNIKNGFYMISSSKNNLSHNLAKSNGYCGFYLLSSSDNLLLNNKAIDNNFTGFYINYCDKNTLTLNEAQKNHECGYTIRSSNYNNITSNLAEKNDYGFFLTTSSNYNELINNIAQWNNNYGFHVFGIYDHCDYNNIMNNIARNNGDYGLNLDGANFNIITNNSFQNNKAYGISLITYYSESNNNSITFNDFYSNNEGRIQAISSFSTNTFNFNHWSDHLSPDYNRDGIVDLPYQIAGNTLCKDYNPVTTPYRILTPTFPKLLEIKVGDTQITLSWMIPDSDGGSSITEYKIYRSTTNNSDYTLIDTTNEIYYIDSGLINGITYFYTVSAVNSAGESEMSNEVSATPKSASSSSLNNSTASTSLTSSKTKFESYIFFLALGLISYKVRRKKDK